MKKCVFEFEELVNLATAGFGKSEYLNLQGDIYKTKFRFGNFDCIWALWKKNLTKVRELVRKVLCNS